MELGFLKLGKKNTNGTVLSPQQLEEQQTAIEDAAVEAYDKKLTAEYVKANKPDLYHAMRLQWLRDFHTEDLDASPATFSISDAVPWATIILVFIEFIMLMFKK